MRIKRYCECCGEELKKPWQVKFCSLQCYGKQKATTKREYTLSEDGLVYFCTINDEVTFCFDAEDYDIVADKRWAACTNTATGAIYITDPSGKLLHQLIMPAPQGYEIDHRNLDTLNNCKSNLRICTHRENQCNQPLQVNNTSGVTGVKWQKNRKTWNAEIKHFGQAIHLGVYHSFLEAVQARNEGMLWLFKEYGRYNDVPEAPQWIKDKVAEKCQNALDSKDYLSVNGARRNNRCGFKGISILKNGRFLARIGYKGRAINLGCYKTIEEAAQAYDNAARFYFGDFACTNAMLKEEMRRLDVASNS